MEYSEKAGKGCKSLQGQEQLTYNNGKEMGWYKVIWHLWGCVGDGKGKYNTG